MAKSRGRGIDFEHRFLTSRWAEDLLATSLGKQHGLHSVRFGLSEIRSASDLRYDKNATYKEPDLLVYALAELSDMEKDFLQSQANDLAHVERRRFERGAEFRFAVDKALAAIEVEFSPYKASEMKGRNWHAKTEEQWEKRPLITANPPTAPNIWVKLEDFSKLLKWERDYGVPVIVAHLFDQEAFAIPLRVIEDFESQCQKNPEMVLKLQNTTGIFRKEQAYDRVDAQGARETKPVFVVAPFAAIKAGDVEGVTVESQLSVSASKKYVTHPIFSGGQLHVTPRFLELLRTIRRRRR